MKKSKKKDRKGNRLHRRYIKTHCKCGSYTGKEYLERFGKCRECYMHEIGMSWSDFM